MIDFNLDIYEDFILENYDYNEGKNLITECRNYLSENTNKGNIVSKIFNVIKRFIKWIIKYSKIIINKINDILYSRTKSVEQILLNMGIKPNLEYIKESSFNYNELIKPYFVNITDEILINNIELDLNKQREIINNKEKLRSDLFILGYKTNIGYYDELFKEFKNFLINRDMKKLINISEEYIQKDHSFNVNVIKSIKSFSLKINKLDILQKDMLEINLLISQVENDIFNIKSFSSDEVDTLVNVQNNIIFAQEGLNMLLSNINVNHFIDKRFEDKIDNINELGFFVEEMIKNRYTGDSIIKNIQKVYKYYDPKNNDYKIGLGRIVMNLTNNDKVVHKIAYNGFGIKSNKNEIKLDVLNKSSANKLSLAIISNSSKNKIVIEMEKVIGNKISEAEADKIQDWLNNFDQLRSNRIICDIHYSNVLKTKDGYKIIDYGNLKFVK